MKKSFQLFLALIIVFVVSDRLIYYGLNTIDKSVFSGQVTGKANQFLQIKDSVDLLVFGSSRANHHVNNLFIDSSSFNMGVDATKIAYSAALISTLNKPNQYILVHIDQMRLFNNEYRGKDVLSLINLVNREENIKKLIHELFPEEIYLSKISNCYVYNGKALSVLKNYFFPKYDYQSYFGYDPLYPSIEQKKIFNELFQKRNESSYSLKTANTDLVNPVLDHLITIIQEKCKTNNSRLIFFTSPTLNKTNPSVRVKVKEYFLSKNIDYFDYSDFIDDSNLENWKDFSHLSSQGANLLSKELQLKLK